MEKMVPLSLKKCVQCGGMFKPRRSHTLTCSNLCRLRKSRGTTRIKTIPLTRTGVIEKTEVRNRKKGVLIGKNGKPVQVKLKIKGSKPKWATQAYTTKKKPPRIVSTKRK